ncbi:N-formylglutamate amidohydrolase [Qipengyuania sp. 1NDH17]|uniref:N-formylglutamate amidohydrolase n=1 Tax=Qipengyuania polymorpha TaxID=2867234 RepID=A0ABS7IUX9_9SPHN|nr:N-formylglutamate amidohydrolase [Qipengyuania polymorpha]MBX7457236.1 N-formylglutamate amidohydrolase [Qipengyuania polymorpha]
MSCPENGPSGDDSRGFEERQGAAFDIVTASNPGLPVLIAAPHGGRDYPEDVLANMRDPSLRLRLEDRHVDTLAAEVARLSGAALIRANVPRAIIDLNRAPDDVDWGMVSGQQPERMRHSLANRRARSGLGLVPRRLPVSGELWKRPLPRTELDSRIETIHRPYHQALGSALESLRDQWGASLLVDLHSMPPLRKRHPGEVTPEFVIGDRFGASCDGRLVATALNHLGEHYRPVAHNRPYSGGYVLDRHGAPRRGIHAMQVEVCRTTYLDSRMEEPCARLPAVARLLAEMVARLAAEVAEMGHRDELPQAAE